MKTVPKMSMLVGIALLVALAAPVQGQKGKTSPARVPLIATFRDADGDTIRSDGRGAYVDLGNQTPIVEITPEGDLHFNTYGGGRNALVDLANRIRVGTSTPPDLNNEPVVSLMVSTCCGSTLNVNPLTMQPDEVRLFQIVIRMETPTGTFYTMQFGRSLGDPVNGVGWGWVQVTAIDKDMNGIVDRWTVEPRPDGSYGLNQMQLVRKEKVRSTWVVRDYGDFIMPFKIDFDRQSGG
jgi:hypothetical protein